MGFAIAALPLLVVDELIGDPRYGDPNTDGSRSIEVFYDVMREASVAARFMLIQAAVLGEYIESLCVKRSLGGTTAPPVSAEISPLSDGSTPPLRHDPS